jgi:hypothetical protein
LTLTVPHIPETIEGGIKCEKKETLSKKPDCLQFRCKGDYNSLKYFMKKKE